MEAITIILATYERTEYAVQTILCAKRNLRYPNLYWYVSDDGSRPEHFDAVMTALKDEKVLGSHNERISYGAGLNRGVEYARQVGDLVLPLEDDWCLSQELDLYRYAALLMENEQVGMVRMGYLNANLEGFVYGHSGALYLDLNDTETRQGSNRAFAGHPSLIHRRYFEMFGKYPERWQPGETEIGMGEQFKFGGPAIVWPLALGEHGPWQHIGGQQSYTWNGGVRL